MKVLPVAILVLLAFAAFFMTFLVAPLAVLTIFYVAYAVRQRSASAQPADAAAEPDPSRQWGTEPEPDAEVEPVETPQRRPRVIVESHRERAAAEQAAAAELDVESDGGQAAPAGTASKP